MSFPTAVLEDIRADVITTAVPGALVSVVREERLITGVALGAAGAAATHVLLEEDRGVPWVYAMNAMGAQTRALHRAGAGRLLLDITDNEAEVRQMRSHVGCLGLASAGLVLGAASGKDGWRDYIQAFVSLSTFAVIDPRHELVLGAQWLTNWSLSYRTPTDDVVRLLGNPPWQEAGRAAQ